MKPNEIRMWRPRRWQDFVGAANRRTVERLQRAVIRREPPRPMLFIGPYGSAKTSLARHLIASICCENPSAGGDPCCVCRECVYQGSEHNGMGAKFAHWELDCTRFSDRAEVRQTVLAILAEERVAVFWDEFQRLRVKSAQALLLKPSEDIRGLWMLAMTDDQYRRMDPQLFERFRKVWLTTPTVAETVSFFVGKTIEWQIGASEEIVALMVAATQRSFRSCLDLLAAGAENHDRTLDQKTLEEFLSLDPALNDTPPAFVGIGEQ